MIADAATLVPGGGGALFNDGISSPAISGTNVAFVGNSTGAADAIYADFGAGLTTIATEGLTAIPGGTGAFTQINQVSMDRDIVTQNIAFFGRGESGQRGVYAYFQGELIDIIDMSDTVDGQALTFLSFPQGRQENLAGNTVLFLASLEDGTIGLYLATITLDSDDGDGDGVSDGEDVCPDTTIPESSISGLHRNRWALINNDTDFDTLVGVPGLSFTTADTGGCSCEQIIEELGLGKGHSKRGCSTSAMQTWVDMQSE